MALTQQANACSKLAIWITGINPLQANIPFLYPLKKSENFWFSDISKGSIIEALAWNGLT